MKIMYLVAVSVCALTQASLALNANQGIVDKINKESGGNAPRRCAPLMSLAEEDPETLDRILTVEVEALSNENAKPIVQRNFTMGVQDISPEEEILEIIHGCPDFQKRYKYMISAKQHQLTMDKVKQHNADLPGRVKALENKVEGLEGMLSSLVQKMKK